VSAPRRPGQAHRKKGTGRRPRLRVVRPPRSRRFVFLVAAFVVVGALVVGVVSVQALVAQTSFRMQELARRNTQLTQAGGQLQLEIAELSSPRRIAKEARRLGYRLPDPDELHTIAVSGTVAAKEWSVAAGGPVGLRP
jgi:cell division protein FtsL